MAKKRLVKSNDNKIVSGVIGGLGEYFDVDPTILRLCFLLLCIFTGFFPGIIFYIIASLIVPQRP